MDNFFIKEMPQLCRPDDSEPNRGWVLKPWTPPQSSTRVLDTTRSKQRGNVKKPAVSWLVAGRPGRRPPTGGLRARPTRGGPLWVGSLARRPPAVRFRLQIARENDRIQVKQQGYWAGRYRHTKPCWITAPFFTSLRDVSVIFSVFFFAPFSSNKIKWDI